MRKKFVTIVLSAIMVLALAACGSNDTSAESTSAQITSEPITVASTQRDETEATPVTTAEPTTKPEVTEAPTVTPDATEAPTEQQQPTEQPTEQQQPTEQPTEQQQPTTSSIDAYIHDGVFSISEFGYGVVAGEWWVGDGDVCFVWPVNGWFVQTGHLSASHPNESYIVVGVWDQSGADRFNFPRYVWTCSTGDTIQTNNAGSLSVEALSHLVDVINAMKATNDPNSAPSVSGITFSYDPNFDCP